MLPVEERLLLGPGPSPVSNRVMAALGAPPRSHLDPEMMAMLDAVRAQISRVFRAPAGALTLAVSGTHAGHGIRQANLAGPAAARWRS
jgi:alanine-glyoxylate transaminase/serine-glyoxylate transaminase/serine-pyruvate transaminase